MTPGDAPAGAPGGPTTRLVEPTAVSEVLPGVRTVLEETTRADGTSPIDEATALWLDRPGQGTLWVAAPSPPGPEASGRLDGFALLRGTTLDLVVSPDARGRGAGRLLAEAAMGQAASDGSDGSDEPLAAWSHGNHPAAARLARRLSFRRVRDLWVMRRPTSRPLGVAPAAPAGVRVRTFKRGDEEALLEVNAAAFADHPEQGAWTRADLDERLRSDWFDPDGVFLAVDEHDDEDRLLGFHWTKEHRPSSAAAAHGEVYVLGISPAAQGRGLGRHLTHVGLAHLADRGLPEVVLYVESDNAAAIAVYRSLGFEHAGVDTHVMYRHDPVQTMI